MNAVSIVDQNHERSVVVLDQTRLDHFRNFRGSKLTVEYNTENEKGILIQGKGIIVQN